MKHPLGNGLFLVCAALLAAGCHGSSLPSSRPAPAASAPLPPVDIDASCVTIASASDTSPLAAMPSDSPVRDAQVDVPTPLDSAPDEHPRFGASDVVYHVVNETGGDVFIDNGQPLMLELRGEPVQFDPGCGSHCPSCACKECPVEPPQVRRIPNAGSWAEGWNRRVFVSQHCGGSCPCIREIDAKPGTYTVTLQGKRAAIPPLPRAARLHAARLDERSAGCEAKATFKLARGARVELKLTCER